MSETNAAQYDMGLYDSDTGKSLEAISVVDITDLQGEYFYVTLAYAKAKRGWIVQLSRSIASKDDGARIHYFFNERWGMEMIKEDEGRFGFPPGVLLQAIQDNAPDDEGKQEPDFP